MNPKKYIRPKRFKLKDLSIGTIVEFSYGPRPIDKMGPLIITDLRPSGSKRGFGDRINAHDPKFGPAQIGRGVGFPIYRIGRIIYKGDGTIDNELINKLINHKENPKGTPLEPH